MPVLEEKDFSAPTLKVLLASRLMPDKGVDDFLQTAEKLQGQGFEFVLAGPRSIGFDDILEKVKEYHTLGTIRYLGELNSGEMLSEFDQAHVFFLPSYGEGMARVMLEAGFAQVCPIGYDISANRDLIAEGRGFLAPVGDIDAMVSILRALAKDRELLRANAINYQEHILQNYSMEVFSQRLDEIFKELALELGIDVMEAPSPSLSPYTAD
jgi:glycosyltransferase involved in cell wall biosynthesis